jgi:hypothetical protein
MLQRQVGRHFPPARVRLSFANLPNRIAGGLFCCFVLCRSKYTLDPLRRLCTVPRFGAVPRVFFIARLISLPAPAPPAVRLVATARFPYSRVGVHHGRGDLATAGCAQVTAMGISSPWGNCLLRRTLIGPPLRWFF